MNPNQFNPTNTYVKAVCECGCEEFFIIETTTISDFWAKEYNKGFERNPPITLTKKAVCTNCFKFLKEDRYFGKAAN